MRRLSDFDRQRLGDWIFGLTLNTWPDIEDPHRLTELLKILEQMRDADRDGQQINLNLLFGLSSGGSGAPKNHDSLRLWNLVMSWITADAICTGKSLESYLDVTQKLEVKGVLPGGTCDRSSFFRHLNNYRKKALFRIVWKGGHAGVLFKKGLAGRSVNFPVVRKMMLVRLRSDWNPRALTMAA